jgi:hypothetical protein
LPLPTPSRETSRRRFKDGNGDDRRRRRFEDGNEDGVRDETEKVTGVAWFQF